MKTSIAILVAVIVVGGGLFAYDKLAQTESEGQIVNYATFSEALQTGKDLKCTQRMEIDGPVRATYYFSGGENMRGDYYYDNDDFLTHTIVTNIGSDTDIKMFLWREQGDGKVTQFTSEQSKFYVDLAGSVALPHIDCTDEKLPTDLFVVPSNLTIEVVESQTSQLQYTQAQRNIEASNYDSLIKNMLLAVELYYDDNNVLPASLDEVIAEGYIQVNSNTMARLKNVTYASRSNSTADICFVGNDLAPKSCVSFPKSF